MNTIKENSRPFLIRFWQYQKERFPFVQHGLLITVFTFSAASYSRMCRGDAGFIPLPRFIAGAVTAIFIFLLLRICDEFKDFEDDSKYRPYRAVPRGLITLKELAFLGAGILLFQLVLNALYMPEMIIPFLIVIVYMALMTKEFFVPQWLKGHPMIYMFSHMVIMPLIDGYTTGLDWLAAVKLPPHGVEIFLIVSFFNGIVIEVGRKIRALQSEETGVETYSALYGPVKATLLWFASILVTYITAIIACTFTGFGIEGFILLTIVFIGCSIPGILYIKTRKQSHAKGIENAAGLWTIGMYLIVGATPMIIHLAKTIMGIV
jgi:4-hydroxybenzoate polyprenyltransferase